MREIAWTNKHKIYLGEMAVHAYCVFPISDSTISALTQFAISAGTIINGCWNQFGINPEDLPPSDGTSVQDYASLNTLYNAVTAAFAADGFVIDGSVTTLTIPDPNPPDNQRPCWMGEWFKGYLLGPSTGVTTTLSYNGHPIAMKAGHESLYLIMSISTYNKMAMLTVVPYPQDYSADQSRYVTWQSTNR